MVDGKALYNPSHYTDQLQSVTRAPEHYPAWDGFAKSVAAQDTYFLTQTNYLPQCDTQFFSDIILLRCDLSFIFLQNCKIIKL